MGAPELARTWLQKTTALHPHLSSLTSLSLSVLPSPTPQVRRLKMYKTKAIRDKKGRIIHEVRAER